MMLAEPSTPSSGGASNGGVAMGVGYALLENSNGRMPYSNPVSVLTRF